MAALVGLGFEFAFYLLVLPFKAFEATQLIPAYFYERGWVPFVLTYLAGWSCAILLFKYRKLKTQRAAMLYKLLPDEISKDIRVEALPRFEAHIKRLEVDQVAQESKTPCKSVAAKLERLEAGRL